MNTNHIRQLSDSKLLDELKNSVVHERKLMAEVLEYLKEVDRRRLYADGHSSLWDFCVNELGYSEASASRRISSMRLIRDLPELKEDLLTGKQNLSSLSRAQKHFRIKENHLKAKLTLDEKKEILGKPEGKSSRECEKELLKLSSAPLEMSRPEKKKLLDENHTELRLILDSELLEKLSRIQALRSHASPSMSYAELLKFMADDILKRLDPLEKAEVRAKAEKNKGAKTPTPEVQPVIKNEEAKTQGNRRLPVPAVVKRQVWLRDHGKCGYIDVKSGKSCNSKYFIELDHILPVALGGGNNLVNLRLRCFHHNQRSAIQVFGPQQSKN